MTTLRPKIDTPCVGICSTVYGDTVCRGCKRYYNEIIDWNRFDQNKRNSIYDRLEQNIIKMMSRHIVITDPTLLAAKLEKHHIRYNPEHSPYTWAYHLLRVGADKIQRLENYGLHIKDTHITLQQLFNRIDTALYEYSCALLEK